MNIGIDIVEHKRIKLKIARKVLSTEELKQFDEIKLEKLKIEYLASRFAAKEAIVKATNKKYKFSEITILRTETSPQVNIEGLKISISHERNYSIAICLVE